MSADVSKAKFNNVNEQRRCRSSFLKLHVLRKAVEKHLQCLQTNETIDNESAGSVTNTIVGSRWFLRGPWQNVYWTYSQACIVGIIGKK